MSLPFPQWTQNGEINDCMKMSENVDLKKYLLFRTDGSSGKIFGKFKIVTFDGNGVEKDCTTEDYSVINLAPNAIFKQLELFVGNTNVIDAGVSTYHYKCITETLLSKQLKLVGVVCKLN